MQWLEILRSRAGALKRETLALYFAARHPATPWYAKALVAAIVAYALSPIDLIPDFIPILGFVDDLLVLPLAIVWAVRMIPADVLAECRQRASSYDGQAPSSRWAAAVILLLWVGAIAALAIWAFADRAAPAAP